MFIVSKRNYMVRRADDSAYLIPKDFIGEIPQDVAESDLVQRAIEGGNIAVPEGKKDKELIEADETAEELAAENDIRPDAENLDAITYGNQLIAMCLVEPNLKDTELCTFYGVMDPADVPSIMFSVGEKQIIQDAISEINDIKAAQNVLKMAKNS